MVTKFKDMPPEFPVAENDKEKLMHISLDINKDLILMGSDTTSQYAPSFAKGNNISISINAESKEETDRIFNALSKGGKPTMPLANTFWGSYFGMLTDQYGINWMISYDLPKTESKNESFGATAKQSN